MAALDITGAADGVEAAGAADGVGAAGGAARATLAATVEVETPEVGKIFP